MLGAGRRRRDQAVEGGGAGGGGEAEVDGDDRWCGTRSLRYVHAGGWTGGREAGQAGGWPTGASDRAALNPNGAPELGS